MCSLRTVRYSAAMYASCPWFWLSSLRAYRITVQEAPFYIIGNTQTAAVQSLLSQFYLENEGG